MLLTQSRPGSCRRAPRGTCPGPLQNTRGVREGRPAGEPASLTDVVDGPSTELAVELLGTQTSQIMYGEGPEVQDIVSGEGISLLNHDHLCSQQGQVDGRAETTGTGSNDETLKDRAASGKAAPPENESHDLTTTVPESPPPQGSSLHLSPHCTLGAPQQPHWRLLRGGKALGCQGRPLIQHVFARGLAACLRGSSFQQAL